MYVCACAYVCTRDGCMGMTLSHSITTGTVEELQNEVQMLNNRIDEMSKKAIELNQEKDEIEKVSKH